jgi:Fic family protein
MNNMISFIPTHKLEKALKSLHEQISVQANFLQRLTNEEKSWLHKSALISTIGASTRIENAVLTDAEIEWVDTELSTDGKTTAFEEKKTFILDKLSQDRERSVEEVVGCREVLSIVYLQASELFPITEATLRGLHKVLLSYYPAAERYAGGYKTAPNRVVAQNHDTGEQRTVLEPTPPGPLTETAMRDLLSWYNLTIREHPWPLLVATEFVFRFLAIHPFQDGNGRLGRALFVLALLQSDDSRLVDIVRYISIDRQIERHRAHYYSVLRQTSDGQYRANPADYDLEPLAWFFLKMTESALKDIELLHQRFTAMQKLSENAVTILACFKSAPERRLQVADLITETGIVRRTVQNTLKNLVKEGFLQQRGSGPASRYQLVF